MRNRSITRWNYYLFETKHVWITEIGGKQKVRSVPIKFSFEGHDFHLSNHIIMSDSKILNAWKATVVIVQLSLLKQDRTKMSKNNTMKVADMLFAIDYFADNSS